jgi:uncharacterized protein YndB with AHSA1/START domain
MPTANRGVAPFFFVTVWRLDAPVARVWEAIHASERYPDWWPNVLSVSVLEGGDASGLGRLERSVWKTELPYRFTFDTRVTGIEKPRLIEVAASGDLEGTGRWQLAEDRGTAVTYTWAVRTNKPWMNRVAPLARPFFVWNHQAVMRKGGRGLAQLLGCRLTAFEKIA